MHKNKTIKHKGNAQEIPPEVPFWLSSKQCFKPAVSPAYGLQNKPYGLPMGRK